MEESKSIELPISLGLIIADELKDKYGIDKRKDKGGLNFHFTIEELSKIKSLKIINPSKEDLVGVEKLPELRSLSVESTKSPEFIHPDRRCSICDKDILSIEKCTNLETLSIVNQSKVTDINLSGLTKLEDVNISNNMNLYAIEGIDKLSKLSYLTCYGNKSLEEFKGLDRAIIQNQKNLSELNLDVLLFPTAIGYNPGYGSYNQECVNTLEYINGLKMGLNQVKWCENISNFTATKISHENMLAMHNKACQILSGICHSGRKEDIILAVERYLAENVTYDYDSLKHGYQRGEYIDGEKKLRLNTGAKYGTNSAFNCIMENSCICEGYTRGEQYLLGLKGIKTRNVACIAEKDTLSLSDHTKKDDWTTEYKLPKDGYHSIICISDYYNLYSDPCFNATSGQKAKETLPYSLLTKEEMSKDHTLSFEERKVSAHMQIPSRGQVEESIKNNKLFKNSSTSNVNTQRGILQKNSYGIIRGADGKTY